MRIENQCWKYVLALAFLFAVGCEREVSAPAEPARPSNIPAASVWVGGLDGGVFVRITKADKLGKNIYLGEIHYISGDLSYKGPMKLSPAGPIDFDLTKKESFEGWDGDTLYLNKNYSLKVQK